MKKALAVLLVLGLAVTAVFATDLAIPGTDAVEFPTGKWMDTNYHGVWEFGLNNVIKLNDTTGNVIFDFTQDKISDFKFAPDAEKGLTLSFYCAETGRRYTFSKPLTLTSDLVLEIDRDWTDEEYTTNIVLQNN